MSVSAPGSEAQAGGAFLRHGGRLAAARAAYPRAPEPWLDLSTGVNPRAWRGPRASLAALARLPQPEEIARLEAIAAEAFGAPPECVVAAPGAEAAIRALPALTGARTVAIPGPTYGGHAEAWRRAGIEPATAAGAQAEVVVRVNPNNPDGTRCDPAVLREIAGDQASRGGWLVVDESFVETTPRLSLAAQLAPGLIVLRSFGKFYGLPGVRLGFLLAEPGFAATAREGFGDWRVSAEAIAAGTGAYADATWRETALARLMDDARRLDGLLGEAGFEILGGTALFRLARHPQARGRFEQLAAEGVLTRPFSHAPTRLRFGLPGPRGWSRLRAALETLT
jgi:cobalamin biosynthetic protein CobC